MFSSDWISFFLIISTTILVEANRFKRSPIVGGYEAQQHLFRYAVGIVAEKNHLLCGGGIIGEKYVLTAMHCFLDEKTGKFVKIKYTVIAGTNNYKSNRNAIRIKVTRVLTPNDPRKSDIAVLKLAEKLDVVKNRLQILKLPVTFGRISVGLEGIVAGFGACDITILLHGNEEIIKNQIFDGKLRYANVKVVNKAECSSASYSKPDEFLAKMIKNTNGVYGLCYGDSGSPFVHQSGTAIGVMLYGPNKKCDGRRSPAGFMSIKSHLRFIHDVLNGNITNAIRVMKPAGIWF